MPVTEHTRSYTKDGATVTYSFLAPSVGTKDRIYLLETDKQKLINDPSFLVVDKMTTPHYHALSSWYYGKDGMSLMRVRRNLLSCRLKTQEQYTKDKESGYASGQFTQSMQGAFKDFGPAVMHSFSQGALTFTQTNAHEGAYPTPARMEKIKLRPLGNISEAELDALLKRALLPPITQQVVSAILNLDL